MTGARGSTAVGHRVAMAWTGNDPYCRPRVIR